MKPIEKVVETCLYVEDLDRAEAFYRDVLGLEMIASEPGRHRFFRVGEGVFLLFRAEATLREGESTPHGARGPGHAAFGIPPGDLDAWKERLAAHGVAIEDEVAWPRGGRSFYFRDPGGNLLELVTPGIWGLPSGW